MGNKDKTEKLFVACRDVFAELINVLVYHGEKILSEEAILPGPTESIYQGQDAELANQFQDYSMYEVVKGEVYALYTLENQSRVDYQMALRHAGYDGAAYRRQYVQKKSEEKGLLEKIALEDKLSGRQGIYPVISMVLNWGDKRWTAAAMIRELIEYPVHAAAEDYLDRNRTHVFDMRFLDKSVREQFEGDVRVVLDYLSDRESLIQRRQRLRNPEEVLRMLHALSGDVRYLENITFVEEGGKTVCDLLDEMMNKGIEQGKQEGLKEGLKEGIKEGMITTCKELGATFAETSARLKEKFPLDDAEVQRDMALYW